MDLATLFCGDCTLLDVRATSPKQLIQTLSERIAASRKPGLCRDGDCLSARDIATAALERERLGTTGVGGGVALPHARIPGVQGVHAVFARLADPIDFESVDDRPVDLVVMLVAPEDASGLHLRALAKVSRLLRREDVRARLRAAPSPEAAMMILCEADRAAA